MSKVFLSWLHQSGCTEAQPSLSEKCADHATDESFIEWAPNDPYNTPTLIPAGYALPPWYVVGMSVPYVGLEPGDVITDLLHSPFNTLASGFPRFRVKTSGRGVVELHMLRFPTASIVFYTIDGNPTTAKWQDLNSQLAPVGGTFDPVSIIEVPINQSGDHFIDVTIVSAVGEAFPFVHFGGGIRKIVLCGFPEQSSSTIAESDYEMALCEQLRFQDGKLQAMCCGEWTDIAGQGSGVISTPGVQPPGQDRPPAGESSCFNVTLNANQRWQLPFAVLPGDTVTITGLSGTWSDGGISPWYTPEGFTAVFGFSTGGGQGHSGGDPDSVAYHMELIAFTPSESFPVTDSPFVIAGSGMQQLTLQANDATLSDNAGSIALNICVTNGGAAPVGTWCKFFDFTVSDYGFTPSGNVHWVLGQGWVSTAPIDCHITMDLATVIQLTHATMTMPTFEPTTPNVCAIADTAGSDWCSLPGVEAATVDFDFTGCAPQTGVQFYFQASGAGTAICSQLQLEGIGTNPFGSTNC